jgi:hypothetical protein
MDDKFQVGTQPNPKLAGDERNPFQLPTKRNNWCDEHLGVIVAVLIVALLLFAGYYGM